MPSDFQWQAAFMWPYCAKKRNIRGDGAFAIINKCNPRGWVIWLYPTPEARAAKLHEWQSNGYGCCSGCLGQHIAASCVPDPDWQARKLEESVNKRGRARR